MALHSPLILHIETATEVCSVCLSEGQKIIASSLSTDPFVHTRKATIMIDSLFDNVPVGISELDAISLSEGPGSYTGLRVGASIAKGICFGLDIPLISVSTLHALALASKMSVMDPMALYIAMIDARRMEVYMSQYLYDQEAIILNEPFILTEDSFLEESKRYSQIVFSGNGQTKFNELINHENYTFTDISCDARHLVSIALNKYENEVFSVISSFSPNYIKPANVTKSKKRLI